MSLAETLKENIRNCKKLSEAEVDWLTEVIEHDNLPEETKKSLVTLLLEFAENSSYIKKEDVISLIEEDFRMGYITAEQRQKLLQKFSYADSAASTRTLVGNSQGEKSEPGYTLNRTLKTYCEDFGNEFINVLSKLRANDIWVDMGHGDGIFLKEYVSLPLEALKVRLGDKLFTKLDLPSKEKRGKVVGIGHHSSREKVMDEQLREQFEKMKLERPDAYREETGRFYEKIPDIKLKELFKNAKIVTDNIGVFSYVHPDQIRRTFERTLKFMPRESLLMIRAHFSGFGFIDEQDQDDPRFYKIENYLFEEWLSNIKGAQYLGMVVHPKSFTFYLRRTNGSPETPPIDIIRYYFSIPPLRIIGYPNHDPDYRKRELKFRKLFKSR